MENDVIKNEKKKGKSLEERTSSLQKDEFP